MKKHKIKFYTRFGQDIRDGVKTCTIRNDKPGRILPEVGQALELVDHLTGKSYNPGAKHPICAGVWPVEIDVFSGNSFQIKTKFFKEIMKYHFPSDTITSFLKSEKIILDQFASMTGFSSSEEMFRFYSDMIPLKGHLISWGKK